jgi:pyridoxine/pyridoxamine 5'-phosphate oxidase
MSPAALRGHRGMTDDNAAIARTIIDSNRYMTLSTADASGLPWVSPVWFATVDCRRFFWVSDPDARHSRNLASRPQLAIVIFDSTVAVGDAQPVYMSSVAEELTGSEADAGMAIFAQVSEAQGLSVWTRENVQAPARHRLYRATASQHFLLRKDRDERVPVSLG